MTLEQQLDALIAEHGLFDINISRRGRGGPGKFTRVSMRSTDGYFAVTTQGSPAEQIAANLKDIAAQRTAPAIVPELACAA